MSTMITTDTVTATALTQTSVARRHSLRSDLRPRRPSGPVRAAGLLAQPQPGVLQRRLPALLPRHVQRHQRQPPHLRARRHLLRHLVRPRDPGLRVDHGHLHQPRGQHRDRPGHTGSSSGSGAPRCRPGHSSPGGSARRWSTSAVLVAATLGLGVVAYDVQIRTSTLLGSGRHAGARHRSASPPSDWPSPRSSRTPTRHRPSPTC